MSSVDNIGCFLTVRSIMIGQVSTPTTSSIHKNYAWLHFYLYTKESSYIICDFHRTTFTAFCSLDKQVVDRHLLCCPI